MHDILLLDAHPRAASFGTALADAYADAARTAGAHVERLALRDLTFDPILREGYAAPQALEPDLARAQTLLREARHVTFQYPIWWGTTPALLKGFLDRTFLPGFAFRYAEGGRVEKLLGGRSARLLTTLDWPLWAWEWILGAPGRRAMKGATLEFCGITPVRVSELGPIHGSTDAQRARWLAAAADAARVDVKKLPAPRPTP